jgi:uncharacterized protein YndB with AHSA1/START domain
MPSNKDFKRLVRGRMRKTGESYTATRANLLKHRPTRSPRASRAAARPAAADYAAIAGMSDAAVKAKTGCTWERWVKALDHVRAFEWRHHAIATHVADRYGTGGWWAQTVTVGYERIRGLRERGQRRSGEYEVTKSRTLAVPVGRLFNAFRQPRVRSRWLPGVRLTVRTATPNRSIRFTWEDGASVSCGFLTKGRSKSTVQVGHAKLRTRADVARTKRYWAERLDALAALLAPRGAAPQ